MLHGSVFLPYTLSMAKMTSSLESRLDEVAKSLTQVEAELRENQLRIEQVEADIMRVEQKLEVTLSCKTYDTVRNA
jgi:septal ring factor EnvC (AmiA/AmiB activator)